MARVFLKRLNSSTAARLYTFRAVILSTLSTAIASAFFAAVFSYPNPVVYGPCILCLITIFHHLLMLSPWLINFTVADIVLVGTELIGFCVLLSFLDSANTTLGAFLAVNIAALCFSLYFRYVGRNLERFNLFGGCNWAHPPYKSWEIILGRSALRPLVSPKRLPSFEQ
ncbi:hypothetical protein B0H19DRAFT_205236 [Mycena capillaripes]|nr:hypothetical protein B0H19DRAFT_205236 [Mycena capillaripes]